MTVAFVLALMILGIMEASMIRRPSIPLTRKSGVTTVVGSSALPMRQVPTGVIIALRRRFHVFHKLSVARYRLSRGQFFFHDVDERRRCNDRPEIFQRFQQPP